MLTKGDFILRSDVTALAESEIKNNKRAELNDGTRYLTGPIDLGSGVLLAGGNYANPIPVVADPQTAINTDDIATLKSKKVMPQTVSGLLVAGGDINQIRDSGAFTMPLANSVDVDTILVVELPDTYATQTPTLTRTGGDLFEDENGTDTDIAWVGAAKLTFTSDGVSKWSL